jgi:fatty acid desaturase
MATEYLHHRSSTPESAKPAHALWIAAAMTALIGAFFLLREHWGHVAGYWPYLLLLACPVMHLFHGHGGRGHHAGHGTGTKRSTVGEE